MGLCSTTGEPLIPARTGACQQRAPWPVAASAGQFDCTGSARRAAPRGPHASFLRGGRHSGKGLAGQGWVAGGAMNDRYQPRSVCRAPPRDTLALKLATTRANKRGGRKPYPSLGSPGPEPTGSRSSPGHMNELYSDVTIHWGRSSRPTALRTPRGISTASSGLAGGGCGSRHKPLPLASRLKRIS